MKKPVLVTGASGKLGAYVVRRLAGAGRPVVAWSGSQTGTVSGVELVPVDLSDSTLVKQAFSTSDPSGVIHCAALSAVGDCHRDPSRARSINAEATALLGELADRIVYTSTDLVFDGEQAPYSESDAPAPLSEYGRSKVGGEQALAGHNSAAVVRVSLLYGPSLFGQTGFFDQQMEALRQKRELRLFSDEWRTPLALDEAADGLVRVLDGGYEGLLHMAGPERMSREDMGRRLALFLGLEPALVESARQSDIKFPEPRPTDVSLDCSKARQILGWAPETYESGLARMVPEPSEK